MSYTEIVSIDGKKLCDTQAREGLGKLSKEIDDHINDESVHVTSTEKQEWNTKKDEVLSLGIHTDGYIYLFKNGTPVGNGLEIKAEEIAGDVIGYIDENNNIVLSGALAEGTYTVKYEMEDGTLLDIGVLDNTDEPTITFTNLADPTSSDWATGRLGSDGTVRTDTPTSKVTNFIKVQKGDIVRVQGMNLGVTPSYPTAVYNSSKGKLSSVTLQNGSNSYYTVNRADGIGAEVVVASADVGYIRFSGVPTGTDNDIIITVNEPIS